MDKFHFEFTLNKNFVLQVRKIEEKVEVVPEAKAEDQPNPAPSL
jgi:hypothetical protein